MKHWVKEILASVLCTLLTLPLSLIGVLLGMLLYFIYNNVMFLNTPDWLNVFAPSFIGGGIAGIGSTYISFKLLKPHKRGVFISLPLLVMGVSLIGSIMGVVIRDKPWEGAIEPISNAVGVIFGLLYMSKDLFEDSPTDSKSGQISSVE